MIETAAGSLVGRASRGDAAALEELMAQHSGRVYRIAYGITRDHADAEEVTQDVFLSIIRKGGGFQGRSTFSTWIYRVATNAALNKRRGKRREMEVALEECLPAFTDDGHRSGDRSYLLADWSENPEHAVMSGETRRVVEQALDTLPARYRAIITLRDVEQLSNEQAAEIMGESVASLKARLHRARMALREQLTRQFALSQV
jgi:RNA polymerase sigma-70 factor (ECF subfamily)